ncbi:hypothetical protein CEXT_567521 [Caerostris extrusa]|uniref:Uncharacterized protein n=1 Tax=Caerostris extrusa TaxID=172846 RepID=A0AAV4T3C8_CAEEX|nr:hypothetical protein CEXT_567521 [Caerostris extrusa]
MKCIRGVPRYIISPPSEGLTKGLSPPPVPPGQLLQPKEHIRNGLPHALPDSTILTSLTTESFAVFRIEFENSFSREHRL